MNFKRLKLALQNAYTLLTYRFIGEKCCGLFRNPDGRLVECDKWWGYQNCMFPGCGHYQLEHSDGTPNKIIYSKDHPEEVGTEVVDPVGCLNAGCNQCPEFWDEAKLHNFVHLLGRARNHATHTLFHDGHGSVRDENVRHVDATVSVVVQVTTTVASHDREALNRLFAREQKLMDQFPEVQFNFDVMFERQPSTDVKTSITE